MYIPQWTKPALYGAGAGAVALAIIGFGWGGWMTAGSAAEMSSKQTNAALVEALTPYCMQMARTDPNNMAVMAEFEKASSYQKRGIIEDAGWATPLGAVEPDSNLARACSEALTTDA